MRLCRAVILAFLVGGCYAPSPPEGIACGAATVCPADMFCRFGKCVSEEPACLPIEAGPGELTIPRLDLAPVLDGDLADWPTCFVTVDLTTADLIRDLRGDGKFAPGRFSIAAAADRVYVVAEVQSVLPLGNHEEPDVYLNNAISVYFDGDGTFEASRYDDDAAQIVIDHANRTGAFQADNGGIIEIPEQLSATSTSPTTFTIEMSITAASLGLGAFAGTIGFDIGLVGGDGEVMTTELVWHQACGDPECVCSAGHSDSAPYCDARQFGTATFQP